MPRACFNLCVCSASSAEIRRSKNKIRHTRRTLQKPRRRFSEALKSASADPQKWRKKWDDDLKRRIFGVDQAGPPTLDRRP